MKPQPPLDLASVLRASEPCGPLWHWVEELGTAVKPISVPLDFQDVRSLSTWHQLGSLVVHGFSHIKIGEELIAEHTQRMKLQAVAWTVLMMERH